MEADWAWLAGLFEGEGCISFSGKSSVYLNIGMTDLDVLERAAAVTGVGRFMGVNTAGRKLPLYSWRVSRSDHVRDVLEHIRPWLGTRRGAKADAALERLQNVRRPGFCKRGHEMTGANVYVAPGDGQKFCRACRPIRQAEFIKT